MYIGIMDYDKADLIITVPFNSGLDYLKECGYYYIPPEICKDIVIKAGACGIFTPIAIKKLRRYISHKEDVMEGVIPAFRYLKDDIITYYLSEIAESLVQAAGRGKGVEIAIGYPKMLVIHVN